MGQTSLLLWGLTNFKLHNRSAITSSCAEHSWGGATGMWRVGHPGSKTDRPVVDVDPICGHGRLFSLCKAVNYNNNKSVYHPELL